MGTVWTSSSTACLSPPSALVGAGRMILVSLYYRYLLPLTSSKAGNIVPKIQQKCSFSGKLEIIKLIPEVSCISSKARLLCVFREDPSWKNTSLSTRLLMSSDNPTLLVGLPDFYSAPLCGPSLQGVHANAGQLCCQTSIR